MKRIRGWRQADIPLFMTRPQVNLRITRRAILLRAVSASCRPPIARRGPFIGRRVVLMPSFVNIGAYIDENTMIDSWATVGSCAQIGKSVHLSSNAVIG